MKCDPGLIPGEQQIFFPELGTSTNSETQQVVKEQPSRNPYCSLTTVSGTAMSKDWLLNDPVDIFEPERKQKRALDSKTRTTTSTRFSQYLVVLLREPASFWRENVIAVVILLRVLARMS